MKKISLTLVGVTVVGTGVALYYYWRQMNQLPGWQAAPAPVLESTLDLQDPSAIQGAREQVLNKIKLAVQQHQSQELAVFSSQTTPNPNTSQGTAGQSTRPPGDRPLSAQAPSIPTPSVPTPIEITLNPSDLNGLLLVALGESVRGDSVLKAASDLSTVIRDGTVETGLIIDPTQLPDEALNSREAIVLKKAVESFPFPSDRALYVGVEGQPQPQEGRLSFGDDIQVKVGSFSLSLRAIADRLGVSEDELVERLSVELKPLAIQTIKVTEQGVLIQGAIAPAKPQSPSSLPAQSPPAQSPNQSPTQSSTQGQSQQPPIQSSVPDFTATPPSSTRLTPATLEPAPTTAQPVQQPNPRQ